MEVEKEEEEKEEEKKEEKEKKKEETEIESAQAEDRVDDPNTAMTVYQGAESARATDDYTPVTRR